MAQITKQFVILSILVVLSYDLAHLQGSPTETTSHNGTSRISPLTSSTTLKTTPTITDQDPFIVVANLTNQGDPKTLQEPLKIFAKIKAAKPEEGKAPLISLVPPKFAGAPLGLVAHVPAHRPVEIDADVPPGTPIKVQTEVSPDVPLVAVVIRHGTGRVYSPWRKASSSTHSRFNVNIR